MLPQDVQGSLGPDVIAIENVPCRKRREVLFRDRSRLHQLTCDLSFRIRALLESPRDRRRIEDRHPIHLRRRHALLVRGVVERRDADHLFLVAPRLDARLTARGPDQRPVEQHAVPRRSHARDHGRVVRPGDAGVDRNHAFRGRALLREAPERWSGQIRIVQRPAGEAVEADDHDMIGARGLRRNSD